MLSFIAIFFQQVSAPVSALVNRCSGDCAEPAPNEGAAKTVALAGNPVTRKGTNRAANESAADAAAFLAIFKIGQLFGPFPVNCGIARITAVHFVASVCYCATAWIKAGVDVAT